MVMTNFSNKSMEGKDYRLAEGKGGDRYIICHDYLKKNAGDFTVERGLELLMKAYNRDPEYPTACSMVFDPQELLVYIALFRDFDRIWQVSLSDKTIKKFKGFDSAQEYSLDETGLLISELVKGENQ